MEPVKYQFSRREYVLATAIRFMHRREFVLAEITVITMAIAFWFLQSAPAGFAIIFTVASVSMPLTPFYWANRIVKTNPSFFLSEIKLIPNSDGIRVVSETGSSDLQWSAFKKRSETNKFFFLQCSDMHGMTIPKRTFTDIQLLEFKTLLAEKIQPLSKEMQTNKKQYGALPLFLSLISLVLSALPLTIDFILETFDSFSSQCVFYLPFLPYLMLFAWIPALVIAVFAFKMSRHTKNMFLRIANRILSFMALCIASLWAILVIIAMLVSLFHRTHQI
jgi:hypothetical protein